CGLPLTIRMDISKAESRPKKNLLEAKQHYEDEILPLIAVREELIKVDKQTLPLDSSLRELNTLIAAARDKYFRGMQEVASWTGTFEVRPNLDGSGMLKVYNGQLMRIDEKKGVCLVGKTVPGNKPLPKEWQTTDCGAK